MVAELTNVEDDVGTHHAELVTIEEDGGGDTALIKCYLSSLNYSESDLTRSILQ